jgi:uncharacterized membrane protein
MRRSKRTLKLGWRELWPVWAVFGGLIAFGIVGLRIMFPTPTPPTALKAGEDLTLNLSDLEPGKVRLFTYPATPQTQVDFFVERGTSSDITVAFASCRRCYRSGHYERDGQILCGHCNEPMERLGPGQTPLAEIDCKPIPIAFEKSGNQLVVRGDAARATFAQMVRTGSSRRRSGSVPGQAR